VAETSDPHSSDTSVATVRPIEHRRQAMASTLTGHRPQRAAMAGFPYTSLPDPDAAPAAVSP
jgi:hypothetical protein